MLIAGVSNFMGANQLVHPRRLAEGLGVNAINMRRGSADFRPLRAASAVVADAPAVSSVVVGDTVVEGNTLVYTVTLAWATRLAAIYSFSYGGGTASMADYTSPPIFSHGVTTISGGSQIVVPVGVTTFTISIATVDDTADEPTEILPLTVGGVSADGNILDNDEPSDAWASDVIAHLWFDGDMIDRSQFAATYSAVGGAVLSGTQTKFGSTSLDTTYYDTPGSGYYAGLTCSGTHLAPGNEFTVEFWYWEPPPTTPGNQYHFQYFNTTTSQNFRIYSPNFGSEITFDTSGGGPSGNATSGGPAWHHVALTFYGSVFDMYLDGVKVLTKTISGSIDFGSHLTTTGVIYIGSGSSPATSFACYYSNFRFTKRRRYTTDFSVPTAPFPDPVP